MAGPGWGAWWKWGASSEGWDRAMRLPAQAPERTLDGGPRLEWPMGGAPWQPTCPSNSMGGGGEGGAPAPPPPASPPRPLALRSPLVLGGYTMALISVTLMLVRSDISTQWTYLAGAGFHGNGGCPTGASRPPERSPVWEAFLRSCLHTHCHSPSPVSCNRSGLAHRPPDCAARRPGLCLVGPRPSASMSCNEHTGLLCTGTQGIHVWPQSQHQDGLMFFSWGRPLTRPAQLQSKGGGVCPGILAGIQPRCPLSHNL